jgi:release factor glutamine methyltransferase
VLTIKDALKQPLDPLDAELLLAFVLKKDRAFLFIYPEKKLTPTQVKKFLSLVKKGRAGWPVAYLTGKKEFFGLDFFVNKNALIPRPETEGLVELVLKTIQIPDSRFQILDIGTGSGNIIISLAKNLYTLYPKPSPLFFASDISKKALVVAKKNARLAFGSPRWTKQHAIKITFKQGSLLNPWKNQYFDIIIANLPYLAKRIDPSTKFEPTSALVAAKKGLALYEELFKQIALRNNSPQPPLNLRGGGRRPGELLPKYIFLEIGHDQTAPIKKLAKKYLPDFEIKIFKDLAGWARFAVMEKKSA